MPSAEQLWDLAIWQALLSRTLLFVPQLLTGIVLFAAFWIGGIIAGGIIVRVCRTARIDSDLGQLLSRIARITLIVVGAMTALGTLGVNVTALVTGLGLTGFALGFAFKDIISNALAGILVIIYEPFRRNDRILVAGLEGAVSEINLRYTVLETEDKRTFIPNANLFTNPVVVLKRGTSKAAPALSRDTAPAIQKAASENGALPGTRAD
jgi:small-conductance mechanosensitive channel